MNKRRAWLKNLLLFTQLGLSVISPILVCVFIGWLLQSQFGTPSWVMLICILTGLASGLLSAWRLVRQMLRISNGEDVSGKTLQENGGAGKKAPEECEKEREDKL